MRRFLIAAVATLALAGFVASAEAAKLKADHLTTSGFVQELQSGGQFEIESSTIALQKTKNEDLRAFAQKMIDDHKAAAEKLLETLKQDNLPKPEYAILEQQRDLLNTLIALTGAQFEHRYVEDQVDAHQETVKLLEAYSEHGDNAALKQLATSLLPTIKEHLQMAEGLRTKVTARR